MYINKSLRTASYFRHYGHYFTVVLIALYLLLIKSLLFLSLSPFKYVAQNSRIETMRKTWKCWELPPKAVVSILWELSLTPNSLVALLFFGISELLGVRDPGHILKGTFCSSLLLCHIDYLCYSCSIVIGLQFTVERLFFRDILGIF